MTETRIAFGGAIKALGDGRVGGYLVRFTDANQPDLYGEYFDEHTNFYLEDHPMIGKPVMFNHGLDEAAGVRSLGTITALEVRTQRDSDGNRGVWIEAQLKQLDDYVRMLDEAEKEAQRKYRRGLGWSSGALPQSVDVNTETGHIKSWAMIEGSLTFTPADPGNRASIKTLTDLRSLLRESRTEEATLSQDEHLTEDSTIRIATKMNEQELRDLIMQVVQEYMSEMRAADDELPEEDMRAEGEDVEELRMEDEEELEAVASAVAERALALVKSDSGYQDATNKKQAAKRVLKNHEMALFTELANGVYSAREERKAARAKVVANAKANASRNAPGVSLTEAAGGHRGNGSNNGNSRVRGVTDMRYDHMNAQDMMVGFLSMSALVPPQLRRNAHNIVSEDYFRAMVHKWADFEQGHTWKHKGDASAIRSFPFRSDEINASNISGQGSDWVEEALGTVLWEKARDTQVFDTIAAKGMMQVEIPRGAGSIAIPTEGADPTAYSSPQANDLDSTNRVEVTANPTFIGTGSVTLTPGEIKILAATTDILIEDSVIPFLPQMTAQVNAKAQETLTELLLNGDTVTTASTNLNLIDDTPGTGISRPYYLASDGIIKYPIITNTAKSYNGAGTLALAHFRNVLKLLTSKVRTRRDSLLWLMDADVETAALALPELATDDVRRTNATITSGVLQNVFGIDSISTGFIVLANSAGKVPAAGGTLGRLVLVYAPYWAYGFRRRVTFETDKDILAGATYVVASMRVGFQERGVDAAAAAYNVGV